MLSIKERQTKLKELGYYKGNIDGIVGPLTKQAYTNFQKDNKLVADSIYGIKTNAKLIEVTDWKNIKYFKKSEFTCKCGCGSNNINLRVVKIANQIREYFNSPCIINSGTRCTTHNKNVGGFTNSRHLSGKAIDIYIKGINGDKLLTYTKSLVNKGILRYTYRINNGNAIHIDIN